MQNHRYSAFSYNFEDTDNPAPEKKNSRMTLRSTRFYVCQKHTNKVEAEIFSQLLNVSETIPGTPVSKLVARKAERPSGTECGSSISAVHSIRQAALSQYIIKYTLDLVALDHSLRYHLES